MNSFYFIGSVTEIGNAKLEKLGQAISLSDSEAMNAVLGGAALLPKEQFDLIGFTSDELRDYAYPGQRASAPDEFNAKLLAARHALHEYRTDLEAQVSGNR